MHKIFENQEKQKITRKNKSPFPALKARGESEKDREIRIIENLYEKKLNKDYIDRLITLLYNSKNKLNYSKKRNNIKKAIYKLDENNEFYLTLPKIKNKNKNNIGMNNYTKTETTESTNNKITSKDSPKKYYDEEENDLDENIKEILYENDYNEFDKKEEEKRGKLLFEQLKTRYENFNFENKNKYKNLSKFKKKQIPSEYKLIATPQQISEFDYNLGRSFVNGNLRYLTKFQKEKLAYIAELNLFNSIDRLKEKTNMIKEIKYDNRNKKIKLMPIDFFKYDAEKWKKYSDEKNQNYNDIIINKLNDENKNKLNAMKDYVNKLNIDALIADKEVIKTINNINNFLNRYGIDNNSSHSSKKSLKRITSKKKEKKPVEEKKE